MKKDYKSKVGNKLIELDEANIIDNKNPPAKRTLFFGVDEPDNINYGMAYGLPLYTSNYVDIVSIFSQPVNSELKELTVVSSFINIDGKNSMLPLTKERLNELLRDNDIFEEYIKKASNIVDQAKLFKSENHIDLTLDDIDKLSKIETRRINIWSKIGRKVIPGKVFINGEPNDGHKYLLNMGKCVVDNSKNKFIIQEDEGELYLISPHPSALDELKKLSKNVSIKPDINDVVPKRREIAIQSVKNLVTESNIDLYNLLFTDNKIPNESTEVNVDEWYVLSDEKRKGTTQQRRFVQKSLSTKKMSVLTGPPGTGKTTTITELVLQIVRMNPNSKILITSQTNVAVENVMEKLMEYKDHDKFKSLNLSLVAPETKIPSLEKITTMNRSDVSAANVIGATTGRALNPSFEFGSEHGIENTIFKDGWKGFQYFTKEFDYIIVDEASKTTLVDFIPVASLGNKWIIVGDDKQLSPMANDLEIAPAFSWFDRELKEKLREPGAQSKKISHSVYLDLYTLVFANYRSDDNDNILFIIGDYGKHNSTVSDHINKHLKNINVLDDIDNYKEGKINILFENDYSIDFQLNNNRDVNLIYLPSVKMPKLGQSIYQGKGDNAGWKTIDDLDGALSDKANFTENFINQISWRIIRAEALKGGTKDNHRIQKTIDNLESQVKDIYDEFKKTFSNKNLDENIESLISYAVKGLFTYMLDKLEDNSMHEQLVYQYRMKDSIAKASRKLVYQDLSLFTDTDYERQDLDIENISNNVFGKYGSVLKDIDSRPNRNYINEKEAEAIYNDIINIKENSNGKVFSVMVMTFHKPQLLLIKKILKQKGVINSERAVQVIDGITFSFHTGDEAQGKEADFTLISFGVGHEYKQGFTDDIRRLNVMMTRAKTTRVLYMNCKLNKEKHSLKEYLREI